MFRIIRLQDIMYSKNFDIVYRKMLEFSTLNVDVENFIKSKAVELEKRNFSKTALIFDDKGNIVAYFSLAIKTLFFSEEAAKRRIKDIQGFTGDVTSVPIMLIGQLSKNDNIDSDITGEIILGFCIQEMKEVQKRVGGRYCLVETLSNDENKKVVNFYLQNNFIILQKNSDGTFYQMIKKL